MTSKDTWGVFKAVNYDPTTQQLTALSGSTAVSPSFLDVSSVPPGWKSKVYHFSEKGTVASSVLGA